MHYRTHWRFSVKRFTGAPLHSAKGRYGAYGLVAVCVCVAYHSSLCHCCRHRQLSVRSLSLSVPTCRLMCRLVRHPSAAVAVTSSLTSVVRRSCFVFDYATSCCMLYSDLPQIPRRHQIHLTVAPPSTHSQYYVEL